MNLDIIYITVAFIGCATGVFGWIQSKKNNSNNLSSELQILETRINHLIIDIEDMKKQIEDIRGNIKEGFKITLEAKAKADAAHDRLDLIKCSENCAKEMGKPE